MRLLRIFASQTNYSKWLEVSPELSFLLACFDIKEKNTSTVTVSTFCADTLWDELEVAAALVQNTMSKAEKRYGVRIDTRDCIAAGIEWDLKQKGETGIDFVDSRHVNLTATREQFTTLMTLTVAKIWQGHDQLRVFPANQIVAQLALFERLSHGVSREARIRCRSSLEKTPERLGKLEYPDKIEVRGHLVSVSEIAVVSVRSLSDYVLRASSIPWIQKIRYLVDTLREKVSTGS